MQLLRAGGEGAARRSGNCNKRQGVASYVLSEMCACMCYKSITPRLSNNDMLSETQEMQDDFAVHARWGPVAVPLSGNIVSRKTS